ncbi:MAG: hypothetical protein HN431_04815 [Bacteroidetes bacterium]|nr:hypothetical protein [Bacteroidota bacterium]
MKVINTILLFSFSLILAGIIGKSIIIFMGANAILAIGFALLLVGILIYGIVSLSRKKQRIEAGMLTLSSLMLLGLLFKIQYWAGGGLLSTIGSSLLFLSSIWAFVYTFKKNYKRILGALFLSIGISSIFFTFKISNWPAANLLFIPAAISMIVSLFFLFKKGFELKLSYMVSIIVMLLIVITFVSKESQLHRFRHINTKYPELNVPENYYIYAWKLSKEGEKSQAIENLNYAIQEIDNPNNAYFNMYFNDSDLSKERYERALELLLADRWLQAEKPIY